jgi:hypothetical protein
MNDSIAAIEARHSERGFVCGIGRVKREKLTVPTKLL